MKRTFFLLLTALVLFASTQPAAAQKFQPKTIQFKGAPEYSDQELLAAAGLSIGAELEFAEMKGHSQKLLDTGLFENVGFKFDGVDLVYTLVPSTELYPVRLQNLPLTPGKELDAALHQRFPLYHGKVPAEGGLTEQVRQALEEMLAAKGIKATVAATPFTDQKLFQVTAMTYAITAPPVRIGEMHLEGVSPEMQAEVKVIEDSVRKTNYDTENSADNIERAFALLYTDEGYAAVKVHAVRSGNPVVAGGAIGVPFTVSIQPGQLYKLGAIHLPSGELLTLAEINKAAGTVSNSVEKQSVKEGVALRTALLYITGQYKAKGFMDCVVTPHPQYDNANGIVNYTIEVQPGPVYKMGKLTIENGAEDLRAAMQAAWKMPAGAVFNASAIQAYFSSQGNTPLGRTFASANCKYQLTTNPDTHTVDVTLRLEKRD
jgi:outer membrane protein insertion porin family